MKCPSCGADAPGAFFSECGTPLESARCPSCKAKLAPGASFCNQCGFRLKGGRSGDLMWYVGAVIGVGILVILLLPTMRTPEEPPIPATQGPPIGAPPAGSP